MFFFLVVTFILLISARFVGIMEDGGIYLKIISIVIIFRDHWKKERAIKQASMLTTCTGLDMKDLIGYGVGYSSKSGGDKYLDNLIMFCPICTGNNNFQSR